MLGLEFRTILCAPMRPQLGCSPCWVTLSKVIDGDTVKFATNVYNADRDIYAEGYYLPCTAEGLQLALANYNDRVSRYCIDPELYTDPLQLEYDRLFC